MHLTTHTNMNLENETEVVAAREKVKIERKEVMTGRQETSDTLLLIERQINKTEIKNQFLLQLKQLIRTT